MALKKPAEVTTNDLIAALEAGESVDLPDGTYHISETVTPASGACLRGQGRNTRIFAYGDIDLFSLVNVDNVVFENLYIDHQVTTAAGTSISITGGCSNIRIEGVHFVNPSVAVDSLGTALAFNDSITIRDCLATNNADDEGEDYATLSESAYKFEYTTNHQISNFVQSGFRLESYITDHSTAEAANVVVDATHSAVFAAASSQFAAIAAASAAELATIADLSIELNVTFTTLPSSGNRMALVTKWLETGDERSYRLYLLNTDAVYTLHLQVSGDGIAEHGQHTVWTTPVIGTRYHIAATFDASGATIADQFRIYIDGVAQVLVTDNDDEATEINDSAADFAIAASEGSGTEADFLDGQLFEVRVWNTVRTATEVAEYRNRRVLNDATGLQGYWYRTDAHTDLSAEGNDLTASGSPTFVTVVPYSN